MTEETLSALVVMRSASGERVPGQSVTSETIGQYAPDPSAVSAVSRSLEQAGFQTSPPVGIAFSISAPQSRFESFFSTHLQLSEDGSVRVDDGAGDGLELSLAALPEEVRGFVDAITFTPPPDFGPTDYGGAA